MKALKCAWQQELCRPFLAWFHVSRWSSWKVSTFLPRPKQRPRVEIPSPTFCFTDEFTAHHHEEKTSRAMAISLEPADGCMMGLYYHVHVDYSNPCRSVNQPVENCSNERLKNWFYCTKESALRLVVLQLERWAANFTGVTSTAPYGSNFAGDMQRERERKRRERERERERASLDQ